MSYREDRDRDDRRDRDRDRDRDYDRRSGDRRDDRRDREKDRYENDRYDDRRDSRDSRRDNESRDRRGDDRRGGTGDRTSSLLVRNLSYRIRAEEIKQVMSRYGEVRDVYIPRDYHTQTPRGFAFVEFFNSRDASDALYALQGYKMDGRELTMVFAKDKRKTPEEMREIDPPRRERSRSGDHDDERKPSGHRDRDDRRDRGDDDDREGGHSRRRTGDDRDLEEDRPRRSAPVNDDHDD